MRKGLPYLPETEVRPQRGGSHLKGTLSILSIRKPEASGQYPAGYNERQISSSLMRKKLQLQKRSHTAPSDGDTVAAHFRKDRSFGHSILTPTSCQVRSRIQKRSLFQEGNIHNRTFSWSILDEVYHLGRSVGGNFLPCCGN